MKLTDYIKSGRGKGAALANALRVSASYLSQLASGTSPVSPERCVAIEQATDRQVMRWDLRPCDWWLIWPELKEIKGAPDVPQADVPPSAILVPEAPSK